jgi:hypothetical protein
MGPNRRAQERERAAACAAAEAKRTEAERKAIADAQKIVAIWKARQAGGRALCSIRRRAITSKLPARQHAANSFAPRRSS